MACPFCLSRPHQPCRDSRGRFIKDTHVIRRTHYREKMGTDKLIPYLDN